MRLAVAAALLLLFSQIPALGAPPKPRPYAGYGILIINPASQEGKISGSIIFYHEPAIGRVAERLPQELPLLSPVISLSAGEYPVVVMGKKGNWLKIAYDEADREGWIELDRRWRYLPWEEFLPGLSGHLLKGTKKAYRALYESPSVSAGELGMISPEKPFRIDLVRGDWLRIEPDGRKGGWLRWRDDSGRFLIFINGDDWQEKH